MRTNGDVAWRSLICTGITVQGPDMRSAEWPADEWLRQRTHRRVHCSRRTEGHGPTQPVNI